MSKKVSIILALVVGGVVGVLATLWTTRWPQEQTTESVSSEPIVKITEPELYDKLSRRDEGIKQLAFLLRAKTDFYDIPYILKEIYKGEIFARIDENVIYIHDKSGEVIKTIKPPAPFDRDEGYFPFGMAKISPNQRFVLAAIPIGDGGHVWIYDMQNDNLHEVTGGLGLGELGWLADNRIVLHSGCVAAEYCKKLESVSSETPWVVEVVKDLGRYE